MKIELLIPLILGSFGILQGVLNRQIAQKIGIIHAVVIGSVITLIFSTLAFFGVRHFSDAVPDILKLREPLFTFQWWYIIPGFFGFCLITGLPFAFYKLGAVKVTVGLIAAQMLTSALWDVFVEGLEFNWLKGLGVVFAILSVISIQLSK